MADTKEDPRKQTTDEPRSCILGNGESSSRIDTDTDTDTEEGSSKEDELEAQIDRLMKILEKDKDIELDLRDQLRASTSRIQSLLLRIESIKDDEECVRFYTGFDTYDKFTECYKFVMPKTVDEFKYRCSYSKDGCVRRLNLENEFFLTVCKLRCNFCISDLATRMDVAESHVGEVFTNWIHLMCERFRQLNNWPTVGSIYKTCPPSIREQYPFLRCIIDCVEMPIERPGNRETQQLTWNRYKKRNTMKALIACSPTGNVCFVSDLFGGSVSDRELTRRSGLFEKCVAGDMILADGRFVIEDVASKYDVAVNLPRFPKCRDHFAAEEESQGESRHVGVHIERVIERIKNYRFLDFIPNSQIDIANQCFFVCACLTNYQTPLNLNVFYD